MTIADLEPAVALSPLDGRYRTQTAPLVNHLSEPALNRERLFVEIEWMIFLAEGNNGESLIPGVSSFTDEEKAYLRAIVTDFDASGIAELAAIEARTRHDVKAIEYYIDRRLDAAEEALRHETQLTRVKPLVHFACTSEDINNLSHARSIKAAVENVWIPALDTIIDTIAQAATRLAKVPLLSLTHGQPATPTTMGKEIAVYVYRLHRQRKHLDAQEYLGKLNGATGTFGAHTIAVPGVDWIDASRRFVTERMGLEWNPLTTQIESHDWQAELYSTIAHINRILHNLAVDVWMYISRGVFAQEPVEGATGSSTMPHKVNPIRFENAEANLELSNALLDSLSATLVESRWQRDLSDSTTQRNVGSALGYSLLALTNLTSGIAGIHANVAVSHTELDNNWEVLGEPIQTAMRAAALGGAQGMDDGYERVKEFMRGHEISHEDVSAFVSSLGLPENIARTLSNLTPSTYIGLADRLVDFS